MIRVKVKLIKEPCIFNGAMISGMLQMTSHQITKSCDAEK